MKLTSWFFWATVASYIALVPADVARAQQPENLVLTGYQNHRWEYLRGPGPVVPRSHRAHIARSLGLNGTEREAFEAMCVGADFEFAAVYSGAIEGRFEAGMRNRGGISQHNIPYIEDRGGITGEDLRAMHERLRGSVMEDLRLTLSPEQDARWAAMERDLRRVTTLRQYASVPREQIDLVDVVYACRFDGPTMEIIRSQLEAYAVELDSLLRQRYAAGQRADESGIDVWRGPEKPSNEPSEAAKKTQAAALDALRASFAIQRLNDATAKRLVESLPEGASQQLRLRIGRVSMEEPNGHAYEMQPPTYTHACLRDLRKAFAYAGLINVISEALDDDKSLDEYLLLDKAQPLSQENRDRLQEITDEFHAEFQRLRIEFDIPTDEPAPLSMVFKVKTPAGLAELRREDWMRPVQDPPGPRETPQYGAFSAKVTELEIETHRRIRALLDVPQLLVYYRVCQQN